MKMFDELITQTDTIYLTVVAPKHGGVVIYESQIDSGAVEAAFAGNLEEATKYFNKRADDLQTIVAGGTPTSA